MSNKAMCAGVLVAMVCSMTVSEARAQPARENVRASVTFLNRVGDRITGTDGYDYRDGCDGVTAQIWARSRDLTLQMDFKSSSQRFWIDTADTKLPGQTGWFLAIRGIGDMASGDTKTTYASVQTYVGTPTSTSTQGVFQWCGGLTVTACSDGEYPGVVQVTRNPDGSWTVTNDAADGPAGYKEISRKTSTYVGTFDMPFALTFRTIPSSGCAP